MFFRFFLFLIGFGLTTIGSVYIICYLNLFSIGYNFFDYVNFIIRRVECLNTFIGIIIMILSLTIRGKDEKNELYL
ncbi:MAG: hypothetical protein E7174_01605 [Firmicutes bacterium]|nr:hypothetical protein [Bacillota bacterium]